MKKNRNGPPIGPMTARQRVLEIARRSGRDIEGCLLKYFNDLAAIRPADMTPELMADLQASADDLSEAIRRCAQGLYDLIEAVGAEPEPASFLAQLPEVVAALGLRPPERRSVDRESTDEMDSRQRAKRHPTDS